MNNVVSSYDKVKEQINQEGYSIIRPKGYSMWPFIKNEKTIAVIRKFNNNVDVYDVIFYKRASGAYVLHRVIDVCIDGFVVCGDSQVNTEKVMRENVIGVLTELINDNEVVFIRSKKHLRRVKFWYNHKIIRKIFLKLYYYRINKNNNKKR